MVHGLGRSHRSAPVPYGTDCGVTAGLSLRCCGINPKLLTHELGQPRRGSSGISEASEGGVGGEGLALLANASPEGFSRKCGLGNSCFCLQRHATATAELDGQR